MNEVDKIIQESDWYKSCQSYDLSGVFESLIRYDTNASSESGKIWGDKTPSYIIHVPLLKSLFPESKIIHIVRDARDYSLSIRTAWGKNMVRATDRWVDRISKFRSNLDKFGGDILELRYEDLLENPRKELERICDFLNLAFDEGMLELANPTENLGDTRGEKSIVSTNRRKFLTKMKPKQRESLERIAKPLLEAYSYPFEYSGNATRVGNVEMFAYQVMDGINLIRHEVRNRGLVKGIIFQWDLFRTSGNRPL